MGKFRLTQEGLRYLTMCQEEINDVQRAYPQIRTWLGAALIVVHQRWCRERFVTPITIVAWACWITAIIMEWQRGHP